MTFVLLHKVFSKGSVFTECVSTYGLLMNGDVTHSINSNTHVWKINKCVVLSVTDATAVHLKHQIPNMTEMEEEDIQSKRTRGKKTD